MRRSSPRPRYPTDSCQHGRQIGFCLRCARIAGWAWPELFRWEGLVGDPARSVVRIIVRIGIVDLSDPEEILAIRHEHRRYDRSARGRWQRSGADQRYSIKWLGRCSVTGENLGPLNAEQVRALAVRLDAWLEMHPTPKGPSRGEFIEHARLRLGGAA